MVNQVSQKLWEENQDLVQLSLNSNFIQGLLEVSIAHFDETEGKGFNSNGNDKLSLQEYTHYMKQDTYYLECYSRAYAYCLARTKTSSQLDYFKLFLDGVVDELQFHRFYVQHANQIVKKVDPNLHISDKFEIAKATEKYTQFLLQVAKEQPLACVIAAMVPCTRLYLYLGKQLRKQLEGAVGKQIESKGGLDIYANPKLLQKNVLESEQSSLDVGKLYLNWIQKYSDTGMDQICDKLEGLLDQLLQEYESDDPIREIVQDNYKNSMQLEFEFFEQSLVRK